MVFDNIQNNQLYHSLHHRFASAFAFIQKAIEDNLAPGKYEIDGKELWASIQEYDSKLESDAKAESHQQYIDIQYIVLGVEAIDVFNIDRAECTAPYDDNKDITFYKDAKEMTRCILHQNEYGIFFPHDGHKPGMCINGQQSFVKKIVVKVKV
jgi:YhcH/YjgK/YiaL family protein